MKFKPNSELLVTIGLGVLTVAQFALSSKKQSNDLQGVKTDLKGELKGEILKDVMEALSKEKN